MNTPSWYNGYFVPAKYIHGSEDSTDVDVHYVFDKLPSFAECKEFCDADKSENRNIITISKDGIVTGCYKGTIDEINNGLLTTYPLHEQTSHLLVTRKVERNKPLKFIRAIRIILSHLSRSQYRPEVKAALRSTDWNIKLDTLDKIDLTTIDFSILNKNLSAVDILKVIAFQVGQTLMLYHDIEAYTKSEVAKHYKPLAPFIYRQETNDIATLDHLMHYLIQYIRKDYPTRMIGKNKDIVWFMSENKKFDLVTEKQIDYTQKPEDYEVLKAYLYSHKELFELAECDDVLMECYDTNFKEDAFIDDSIRFYVYIPKILWETKYKEKYDDLADDLYDIEDSHIPKIVERSKKVKEFLIQLKYIREDYIRVVKDFLKNE